MDYYDKAGLCPYLEKLGFNLVGYGCTTCIGNSGPLPEEISRRGQRERPGGRLGAVRQPQLRGPDQPRRQDELPGLAAAGGRLRARRHDGLRPRRPSRSGSDADGNDVFLRDIWPSPQEVARRHRRRRSPRRCSPTTTPTCSPATSAGSRCRRPTGETFAWDADSTYVRKPPYFEGMAARAGAGHRHRRRPGAGHAGRLGDHRPHLARPASIKADSPGRQLPRPSTASSARTSTPTAPGAATTR